MKAILVIICASILFPIQFASAATVLITGSDKGLGLEFVKQYAARGDLVIATCRHPDKAAELIALASRKSDVAIETLDVRDDSSLRAPAQKYHGKPTAKHFPT